MADSRNSAGSIKGAVGVHASGPSIKKGGKQQNAVLGKLGNVLGSDGRPVNSATLKPVTTPQHNGLSAKTSAKGFSTGAAFAKQNDPHGAIFMTNG
jgi:hypothetical protein